MVRPALDAQGFVTAFTGHSSGGFLMFTLAAMAANPQNGIPKPRALISFLPGQGNIPSPAFPAIDPTTKVVIVAADQGDTQRQCGAVSIWNSLSHIPVESRNFLLVQSDSYGTPAQLGNHWFPLSSGLHDTASDRCTGFLYHI
jgi:hypothetical protein